jgi:hypothetical protein
MQLLLKPVVLGDLSVQSHDSLRQVKDRSAARIRSAITKDQKQDK